MANVTDKSILTAAGKALLAQLNAEEKALVIDKMIFANVPNRPEYPQPDDVVPSNDVVHEAAVEQRGRLSVDSVIYSTTLTSQEGPFEFNWTGAYCSEYGVLVTIDHHALTPKTADEPGVSGNTLVRSVVLEYKDIAEITNITVDASTWQYNATPRMKKMDNDVAQANIDQNGKDWFIEEGFLVTPQASAFNIKAGAGYVSGNRVTLEFDRNVQVPNKPSFIYVDAHREGTPTGEQITLFDFVVTAEEKDDYIDSSTGKDVPHFVCKIAQVLADGSVSDLRPEGESASRLFVNEEEKYRQQELTNLKIIEVDVNLLSNVKVDGYSGIRIVSSNQNDNKLWYAWDIPSGELSSFADNEDYGTATLTNTLGETFEFVAKRVFDLRLKMHVDGWGGISDGVISEPSLIASSINENLEPVSNQNAHDNKDAFKAAFKYWLSQKTQFKGALSFSRGSYKTTEPWYFEDQPTVFGELLGDGQTIIDFDFTDKAYKNMAELISCRELKVTNLWLRYLPETNLPECGLLKARYATTPTTDRFSGRHRYSNFRITGKFTISAYYNYATEEQYYENIQFRNYNKNPITGEGIGHAAVVTAYNLHGVSSEYTTIIDYHQSTTVFNMQNPKFEQAGEDDYSVSFLFAGGTGLNIVGGYIQSNGLAPIMLDSSNGACGNITIMSTQLEQSNKDTSDPNYKNFNYSIVLKANTESTPYPASSHNGITVMGLAEFGEKSMLIDTAKTVEKCSFWLSRKVESVYSGTTATVIKSTKFICSEGVDLTNTKTLMDVAITCDKWEDIKVPQSRANTVTLTAQDAPYFEGDTEDIRSSVDGVMTALYGNIMVGNPEVPIKSVVLGSGQPIHGMEVKLCSMSTSPITLQHGAEDGNIYTTTGSDLTPNWFEHVILRWNRRANKFIASVI